LKGTKVGGAEVSDQHANYLLNTNKASSEDVKKLSQIIKKTVFETYNINLEEEVQIIAY
jgi:UDP-N-acetylmuramate dehydrogenase